MTNMEAGRRGLGLNLTWGLLELLGRSVVRGDYHKRSFPAEAEITRVHQVSRSVTREAMKMLAAKGLVQARPKQGTIVKPLDEWNLFDQDVLRWLLERPHSLTQLRQLNEVRAGTEPQAAALAAVGCSAEQLGAISLAFEGLQSASHRSEILDAEINFHATILLGCNNPFFSHLRLIVASALNASGCLPNSKFKRANISYQSSDHDAIKRRDADGARAAMTALLGISQAYDQVPAH